MRVWEVQSGNLTGTPMGSMAAAILVILASADAWLTVGVLLGMCWLTVSRRLNRQRLADWDRGWARVEPQ